MSRFLHAQDGLSVRFWGVRGSICASGPEFVEFGGHTPCLEVRCGERLVIIDAGTGLNALGAFHQQDLPREIDLVFSHLHLDHIGGLPFFKPAILDPDRVVRTYCGNLDGASAAEPLERLYSPPLFPIRLDQLPGRFEHHGFRAGETLRLPDGLEIGTILLNHPQGATGFRFEHGGRSFCYISDLEHSEPWPDAALQRFVAGADLIVYDGMFLENDFPRCAGWGHSTWQKGVELCRAADVKSLAIVHLYPQQMDERLRTMELQLQAEMPTAYIARERQLVQVGAPPAHLARPPALVRTA